MGKRIISGHIEDLHVDGGVAYVNGHVEDLHMNGGVIYNYGHIDNHHQNGGVNFGAQQPERVVYRDRVVEKRVEVVKWKYIDREKIVYRDNDETAHLRDLLDAALEVNHRQADRIAALEYVISKRREAAMPDPWDMEPTKKDCKKLLKQFRIFTDL